MDMPNIVDPLSRENFSQSWASAECTFERLIDPKSSSFGRHGLELSQLTAARVRTTCDRDVHDCCCACNRTMSRTFWTPCIDQSTTVKLQPSRLLAEQTTHPVYAVFRVSQSFRTPIVLIDHGLSQAETLEILL